MTHAPITLPSDPDPDVWTLARRDYLGGCSAAVVAERYGLSERTVRRHAARHGWRRRDSPLGQSPLSSFHPTLDDLVERHPELGPVVDQKTDDAFDLLVDPGPEDLGRIAFRRAAEAAADDNPAQAAAWLRVITLLKRCGDSLVRPGAKVTTKDWLKARCLAAMTDADAMAREDNAAPAYAADNRDAS